MKDISHTPSHDRPVALTHETLAELTQHPLRMLPLPLRPTVTALWACHRHLVGLESPMPLAALISVWISQHGLTVEDAEACCRAMLAPHAVAAHRYASDLTAALAQSVARAIDQRLRTQRDADRRRAAADDAAAAARPDEVRRLIEPILHEHD